jgi:hypothetical protein
VSAPQITAIVALITALSAAAGVIANYIRSASSVGLSFLERSLERLEREVTDQIKTIGILEGKLAKCEDAHTLARAENREKDRTIERLTVRIEQLEEAQSP